MMRCFLMNNKLLLQCLPLLQPICLCVIVFVNFLHLYFTTELVYNLSFNNNENERQKHKYNKKNQQFFFLIHHLHTIMFLSPGVINHFIFSLNQTYTNIFLCFHSIVKGQQLHPARDNKPTQIML